MILGLTAVAGCVQVDYRPEGDDGPTETDGTSERAQVGGETLTPTPTDPETEPPRITGATKGALPGELIRSEFEQVSYELIYAKFDQRDGQRVFSVGIWARNTGASDIGRLEGTFRFYSGQRKLATAVDYLQNFQAGTELKLDASLRENVDVASRWTLEVTRP